MSDEYFETFCADIGDDQMVTLLNALIITQGYSPDNCCGLPAEQSLNRVPKPKVVDIFVSRKIAGELIYVCSWSSPLYLVSNTRWEQTSRDKDGNGLCSGLDKDAVIFWSREHLTGFPNSTCYTTNVSTHGDTLK